MNFSGSILFSIGRFAAVGSAAAALLIGVALPAAGADSGDPWPQSVQGLPTPRPTATLLPAPTSMPTTPAPAPQANTPEPRAGKLEAATPALAASLAGAPASASPPPSLAVPHPPTPAAPSPTPSPAADAWPEQIREVGAPKVSPSPTKPAVLAPLVIARNTPTPDANWPQTNVEMPKSMNQQPTPFSRGTPGGQGPVRAPVVQGEGPVGATGVPTPTANPAWPQNPPPKAEEWQKVLDRASKPATQPEGTAGAPVVTVPVLDAGLIHVSLDGQPAGVSKTGSGWEIDAPVSATPNLVFTLDPKVKGYRTLDIQVHPALNNLPDTRAGLVWVTREASRGFQPGQRASLGRPPGGVVVLGPDGKAAPRAELEPGRTYLARFTVSAVENPITLTVRFTTEKR